MTKPTALATGIGSAAIVCGLLALASPPLPCALLTWTALSCALVAMAYAANVPAVYGKRDGVLPWHRRVLLGPFLAAFSIACGLMRRSRKLPPASLIMPGLYVGGRIDPGDLPGDVSMVIDLVAEFSEPREIREMSGYRSMPVLDGGYAPDEESFDELLREVAATDEVVLVHCDSGKGRAATFAALLLVHRGLADDPAAAVDILRSARPAVAPTRSDFIFMTRMISHDPADRVPERRSA